MNNKAKGGFISGVVCLIIALVMIVTGFVNVVIRVVDFDSNNSISSSSSNASTISSNNTYYISSNKTYKFYSQSKYTLYLYVYSTNNYYNKPLLKNEYNGTISYSDRSSLSTYILYKYNINSNTDYYLSFSSVNSGSTTFKIVLS